MKKLTLTSMMAMLVAGPAIAAVGDTTFTTNQTVANSCVVGVTGVDSGVANAAAQWTANTYACAAGTYLPDGDAWSSDNQYTTGNCAQCTAGNYCAGSGSTPFTYSEANDQGITSCGNTYNHSDAGSTSVDDCYRDCAAADVAHLKSGGTVTGRYYSTGTNQCAPANDQQCATGYHYTAGNPDLTTAIGVTQTGTGYEYISNNGKDRSSTSTYGLTENGTWAVNYGTGKGVIKGKSQCSTRSATDPWLAGAGATYVLQSDGTTTTLPDSTGQYCYCQLTEYTPDGGNAQSLSAPWVFGKDMGDAGDCGYYCVDVCAGNLQNNVFAFRAAVFGSLGTPGPASCQANTISINWKDAAGDTFESGECTYDGAITTPTNAPTKRGHTFGGWRFTAQ